MRQAFRHAPLALVALATACGAPPPSEMHAITVTTTPPGAICVASRNEQRIGEIGPTPAVLRASFSSRAIELSCRAEGHAATPFTIEPIGRPEMGAAYLLLGGVLATVAAAADGQLHKYPEAVAVELLPSSFASIEQRNRAYDKKLAELRQLHDRRVQETRQQCDPSDANYCRVITQPVEAARAAALEALEQQRQAARITG